MDSCVGEWVSIDAKEDEKYLSKSTHLQLATHHKQKNSICWDLKSLLDHQDFTTIALEEAKDGGACQRNKRSN
jgi:hypothetical protein